MFCTKCGSPNDDNNFRCVKCGNVIQKQVVVDDMGDSSAMRMLLPVGRSGLAIAAGYAGLFALLIAPAPLALVLGLLAIRDIKLNPKKHGMGRAVFATVIGAIGTVILLWVGYSLATGA
jgi:hypothetical protein